MEWDGGVKGLAIAKPEPAAAVRDSQPRAPTSETGADSESSKLYSRMNDDGVQRYPMITNSCE